ncbi:ArnT family glycosyltransferase [Namhaeicola litoreus]|uniref:ArnT family glycosyltransferase n=1 Tax=Namhaeicola litoreus TaxID=1052145 RepID=A0ABW3XXG3_9FLAO
MNQNKKYLGYLALVCAAIFLSHLDVIYVNIMEARNFITAREMLQNGNWIHTTMNLEPRYEKPPLPTWLTAVSASVFGLDSLFGLRLPAVLSVICIIFTSFYLGLKFLKTSKQAFYSALILASSFYIIFSGRNGQWDIFAHAFMLLAIYQLVLVFQSDKNLLKNWILAGVFLGLSFMSKGPVSHFALLLPFLIAYGIVYRYPGFAKKWRGWVSLLIFFIVIGFSWGLYIYLTDGSSADAIADKETAAWADRNVRPFYYYWSFFTQSGIWTFFAFIAILFPYMRTRVTDKRAYTFFFLWTAIAVVLLSLIPEKKSRYLLPVLIPLAFTTSFYIEFLVVKGKKIIKLDRWLANFGFGLIGLIGIAFPIAGYVYFKDQLSGFYLPFILVSISLFALGIYIFNTLIKQQYEKAFYSMVLFLSAIMLFGFPMAQLFYDNDQFNNISKVRKNPAHEKLPFYYMGEIAPELIWELGEPAKKIETIDQLSQNGTYGVFVNDSLAEVFAQNYAVKSKTKFDINYVNKNKKGYKERLTTNFLVIEHN